MKQLPKETGSILHLNTRKLEHQALLKGKCEIKICQALISFPTTSPKLDFKKIIWQPLQMHTPSTPHIIMHTHTYENHIN